MYSIRWQDPYHELSAVPEKDRRPKFVDRRAAKEYAQSLIRKYWLIASEYEIVEVR